MQIGQMTCISGGELRFEVREETEGAHQRDVRGGDKRRCDFDLARPWWDAIAVSPQRTLGHCTLLRVHSPEVRSAPAALDVSEAERPRHADAGARAVLDFGLPTHISAQGLPSSDRVVFPPTMFGAAMAIRHTTQQVRDPGRPAYRYSRDFIPAARAPFLRPTRSDSGPSHTCKSRV